MQLTKPFDPAWFSMQLTKPFDPAWFSMQLTKPFHRENLETQGALYQRSDQLLNEYEK